ncbi:MAG TPA: putative quinol monooxygenase [Methanobacterium sp.]
MIIVTAMMNVKPGIKHAFILEAKQLVEATRSEKGCISYDLLASTENDDLLVMLEKWEDIDSLNRHMETDHFKKFGDTIERFLTNEIEVNSYSVDST